MTVALIRYGGTPRSASRVMAPAASLVCSVLKTRWPVSAAWIAISAVARSRISPTMMMSGSCRISARRPSAKPMSMAPVHLGLVEGRLDHLDRVLDRADVDLVAGQRLQRRVQRRRLAAAGGPGDEDDAVRPRDQLLPALRVVARRSPAPRRSSAPSRGRRCASPSSRRRRWAWSTAASRPRRRACRRARAARVLMRPSSGRRFSTTSMRPSSLMRAVIAFITVSGTW